MILADKIINLRKKNGWSQEELAEKMNVSRQAVSKWESAQSVPDLEKILQLGKLFGVTTDYLLKDEIDDEEFTNESDSTIRRVSIDQANAYIEWRKIASRRIALATFMCICSVIPMLLLGGFSEVPSLRISEIFAGAVGAIIMLLTVACAVGIFIHCGLKNEPYQFLTKEPFETEYGVKGIVKEKQKAYRGTYIRNNIIGVFLCVASPALIFIGAFTENDVLAIVMLNVMLFFIAIGVTFFITAGVRYASMQLLLKEGEFSTLERRKTKNQKIADVIKEIYWIVVVAAYLGWSFFTNAWHRTWIIWPVAAVLFGAVNAVCNLYFDKEDDK